MARLALGLDFGTESARALLVNVKNGDEAGGATCDYPHGVIDHAIPGGDGPLPADWALQDPADYWEALRDLVPRALRAAGAKAREIVGVGVDFTASTVLPTTADGTPLCALKEWRREPHAYVKLWKHHAAQPEADRFTEVARARGERFLAYYGGRISSEWLPPKSLEIARHAPEVYAAAARIIEAGDWLVWRLVGAERRSACQAGYKALWVDGLGYPARDYLAAVDPRVAGLVEEKLSREVFAPGTAAGRVTREAAEATGMKEGTPVSIAAIDAHAGAPACGVTRAGQMAIIMGTSGCHMALAERPVLFEGFAGLVKGGILPGYYGYESGQSGMGDIYAWFVRNLVCADLGKKRKKERRDPHRRLEKMIAGMAPGQSGLLALDWWNGNRSVLMDANLSGLLVGMTLGTTAAEVYRALIEGTAFGTRRIVESYTGAGVAINEVYACGGLAKNRALMQVFADVLGRPIRVAASAEPCALGAAMFGALAAGVEGGGHGSIAEAAEAMAHMAPREHAPDPGRHALYTRLYGYYVEMHDLFGRSNRLMAELRRIKEGRAERSAST